jgi:hypothetical protein
MKHLNQISRLFLLTSIIVLSSCSSNNSGCAKPEVDHYSIVRVYADQVAEKFMKGICPNTGKNAYAKVIDYEYDSYHNRYEIRMEAYWTGKPWALANNERYEIDGILIVFSNGAFDFNESYKNQAVKTTISNNQLFELASITVGTLIVLSENK